jgi:hypothetical protein
MNTHKINDDEQDIFGLEALTATHTNQLAMTSTSGVKTQITVNTSLITTNTANIATHETEINALQTLTNTHESEINALQSNELFTDIIKFTTDGSYNYSVSGGNSGSAIGNLVAISATSRRFILVRTDTYSSDTVLANNDTTFTPAESGTYLSVISAEFYDNGNDLKQVTLSLYERIASDGINVIQIARGSFFGSSTSNEFQRLQNTMVISLVAGREYWFDILGNSAGGVINRGSALTNFTLIKINKSF